MTSLSISLSKPIKEWVDTQTSTGRYEDASAYVNDLIRNDQQRSLSIKAMQARVDQAREGGISDLSLEEMWLAAKERAYGKHGA